MPKTVLTFFPASCMSAAWVHAAEPSFDCGKASHEVEELICQDDELATLDRRLAELYGVLLNNTPPDEQKRLKAEQRGWVKGCNDCWKFDDQRVVILRDTGRTAEADAAMAARNERAGADAKAAAEAGQAVAKSMEQMRAERQKRTGRRTCP